MLNQKINLYEKIKIQEQEMIDLKNIITNQNMRIDFLLNQIGNNNKFSNSTTEEELFEKKVCH